MLKDACNILHTYLNDVSVGEEAAVARARGVCGDMATLASQWPASAAIASRQPLQLTPSLLNLVVSRKAGSAENTVARP